MATNIERRYVSNTGSQTELVSSPILWQCVYVIKTVPDFQNLGYRVTKTRAGLEVVVVYREGVSGIFGPPLDPITLTLDPNGRCHLSILFRPVQRVSVVASDSGRIEIRSLMDILRMVAGKGYLFCPGLPEKFLAGKACGKFVVLHKVPFKRYQSLQCPVYYQIPANQQNNAKKSLCSLCPRCMQAAKWIQSLPPLNTASAGTTVQQPMQPLIIRQIPDDQKDNDSSNDCMIMSVDNSSTSTNTTLAPPSVSQLLSLAITGNTAVTSGPSRQQLIKINLPDLELTRNHSAVDMNGNQPAAHSDLKTNSVSVENDNDGTKYDALHGGKLEAVSTALRKLLHEKSKRRWSVSTPIGSTSDQDDALTSADEKVLNGKDDSVAKSKRSLCRLCKKPFSSPASLLNHLQRHEGLSGPWQKQLKKKKIGKMNTTSVSRLRMMLHGSKQHRRKSSQMSQTSMRLLLKCLDDMMPSQNGVKNSRDKKIENKRLTGKMDSGEKKNSVIPSLAISEKVVNDNEGKRPTLKRTSSGLSAMQTLLEAAAIANGSSDGASNVSRISTSSNKETITSGSSIPVSPSTSSQTSEDYDVVSKKPRKSSRLASKRAKGKQNKTQDEGLHNEQTAPMAESKPTSHDSSMLTNLNLLSTVSLETAMFENTLNPPAQTAISNSTPISVLSPQNANAYTKPFNSGFPLRSSSSVNVASPTSLSVSIPNQLLNNTSGGNVHLAISTESKSSHGKPDGKCNLPPLPPLLYARGGLQIAVQKDPSLSGISPKQTPSSTPSESVPAFPWSILRNLVHKERPNTSAASKSDSRETSSGNSDCGAIDLSKPKQTNTDPIPLHTPEKSFDLNAFTGLPHNFAQLVANNDNPAEMLQYLMMVSKPAKTTAAQNSSQPPGSIISDKQSDSDLQARMFASARNYKIGKATSSSSQVQAVIASSSHLAQPGKGQKGGNAAAGGAQGDEIQCGYKWSGSGGLVKERTQMVRELVPPDVMSNFLTRPQLPGENIQQKQQQPTFSSTSIGPPLNRSQDHLSSQLALNLTTAKSAQPQSPRKGTPGRPKKSEQNTTVPPPSPTVPAWSLSPPTPRSILRSSLLHPASGIISHLMGSRLPAPADTSVSNNSLQKSHPKGIIVSHSGDSSPSLVSPPISSNNCTISSPSLAAMLRQPATSILETGNKETPSITALPLTALEQNSPKGNSNLTVTLPGGVQIKTEPTDSYPLDSQDMIIMSLPIKREQKDINKVGYKGRHDGEPSPTNTVLNSPRSAHSKAHMPHSSKAADLGADNTSVKCEH